MGLFKIGLRNVTRNRRRSTLNIIAIAVGVTVLIFGQGWVRGYYTSIYSQVRSIDTGDIQVLPSSYLAEQRRLPLNIAITDYRKVEAGLAKLGDVAAVAPRISFSATIGTAAGSVPVLGRGIDPQAEAKVTVIDRSIRTGSYLSESGPGVLIGAPLAKKLGLSVGDPVTLSVVDKYSAQNYIQTVVKGIYEFGYPPLDQNAVIVNLSTAQQLLGMKGEVTSLVVKLRGNVSVASGLAAVRSALPGNADTAYSWKQFAQAVVTAISSDIGSGELVMLVMYLLIIIGILNSVSMSIQERTREIGTLRAIGIRRRQLSGIFFSEGVWLAIFGSVIGCIFGGIVAYALGVVGFSFAGESSVNLPLPFGQKFTGDFLPRDFLIASAIAVLTTLLGSLFPIRRASRFNIAWSLGAHLE